MRVPEPGQPFDSASALREANRLLLERLQTYGEDDYPDAFLDEVAQFQQRAAATGTFLSGVDDRAEVQSLINFWLTILFNGGRRPATIILDAFDTEAARARAGTGAPYKGLDSFQVEDSGSFFGRRAIARAMLDRLGSMRLLAVTGLSGSGKSSVVRAGLVPRLREGELPGSRDWLILDPIVPGEDPLAALSLLPPAETPQPRLERAEEFVARLDAAGRPVVVSVDQFEELFTLGASEQDRALVLESLAAAASGGRYRHIVVVTMRSEYDSRVETHAAFAELFGAGRIQIGAMSAREIRAAIEQPAAQVGVTFAPGLADDLVQRVLGEPAGLPLLQFTLLELWKRRSSENALTWEAYSELGGNPREILARRASETYESFNTAQDRTFSHRIFLELAEIGVGLEPTARRRTRAELDRVGSRDNVDHVLRVWQENGLIRISPLGPIGPASQVEVAHEALIRNWDRLVGWIEDSFAETRRRRVLTAQALDWKEGAHDTLLGELSLKEAESLDDLSDVELEYVMASRAEVDRANARARRQRQTALAAVVAGLLLLMAGAWQFGRAQYQSRLARIATERADAETRSREQQRREFARAEALSRLGLAEAQRLVQNAQRQEAAARSSYDEARAQLAAALRARDAMLLEQRRIVTRTETASSELAALEGRIRDYQQRLEAQATALASAQAAAQTAEATITRAAMTTAQERPAILVSDLRPNQIPPIWRHMVADGAGARIEQSARSVGLLRSGIGRLSTAFMISDRIVVALVPAGENRAVLGWTIDFGDTFSGDASRQFALRWVGERDLGDLGSRLLLLEVAERNPAGELPPPPLPLSEVTGTGRAAIRRFREPNVDLGLFSPEPGTQLYLIGFPMAPDDDELERYVLRGPAGKRMQPGFVLNATGGEVTTRLIRHDATTFPGNMGSPLFDLATGNVIGIHWGGAPPNPGEAPGKFAVVFDFWLLRTDALRPFLTRAAAR